MRRIFRFLNKFFMVPMFRLGLGFFFGNPWTSYVMVLKTIGRKTGRLRYSPVNYAIHDGKVYCVSGFRQDCDWYRNLRKHPEVTLDFGRLAARGRARTVDDPKEVDRVHGLFRQKYLTARVSGWLGGSFGSGKVVLVDSWQDAGPQRTPPAPGTATAAAP